MDASKAAFTFGRPDLDLLRRFCADRFGWDQDKVDQLIQPVLAVSVAKHHSGDKLHSCSRALAAAAAAVMCCQPAPCWSACLNY